MIRLKDITKQYKTHNVTKTILHKINLTVHRGQRLGILGRNGTGKSTLIKLISGAESPTLGNVSRNMSVSWPLAFTGGFQGSLTGRDNLRFICRVYNADYSKALQFVHEFTELGEELQHPIKTYSSGMLAKLAFAISLAIEFDCFLIDEVIAVGDARFRTKCEQELIQNRADRAIVLVSHEVHNIEAYCDHVAVLHDGSLDYFKSKDEGIQVYQTLCAEKPLT